MTVLTQRIPRQVRHNGIVLLLALLTAGPLLPICQGQERSDAAGVVLTAVLRQSLTMLVKKTADSNAAAGLSFNEAANAPGSLTVETSWIKGPARVSVYAFTPGNPLLGAAGQEIVPVGGAQPGFEPQISEKQSPNYDEDFLTGAVRPSSSDPRFLRLVTGDLRIPSDGHEGQAVTIRADAP